MVEAPRDSRTLRLLLAAAAVLFAVGYVLAESHYVKGQAYKGVVIDKVSKAKWGKWLKPGTGGRKHYLVIRTDAGEKKTVRIGSTHYGLFQKGDRVIKEKGERYPRREDVEGRAQTPEEFEHAAGNP